MKLCSKCGVEKPLDSFYYDKHKADKKRPSCKNCDNERQAKARKNPSYIFRFNKYQKVWQRSYRKTKKYYLWRLQADKKRLARAKEMKLRIIEHYGGSCRCCGIVEPCFLSIDHKNNDGYLERAGKKYRPSGYLFYMRIIAKGYPDNLQILCFNCNIARQHNGGECPHKTNEIICDSSKRKS